MRFILVDPNKNRLKDLAKELKGLHQDAEVVEVSEENVWCAVAEEDSGGVDLVIVHPEIDWASIPALNQEAKTRWGECVVLCWDGASGSFLVSQEMNEVLPVGEVDGAGGEGEADAVGSGGQSVREDEVRNLSKVIDVVLKRKGMGPKLCFAESKYESLFQNLPLGLYLTKPDGEIVDANKTLIQMFGFNSLEDMKKKRADDLFADPSVRKKQIDELKQSGVSKGVEIRIKREDNRYIWVRDHARVVEDFDGGLLFQGVMEDVTEKKESGRRLRRLNEEKEQERMRLAGLVENFPEGVLVLDRERCVVIANPLAKSYLELLGKKSSLGHLVGLGDRSLDDILKSHSKGRVCEVKISHPRERLFEVMGREVDGGVHGRGWVVVIREVTREREESVQARRQERLVALGQMAAGIAHDFGNIVTVISTYCRGLLEDEESSRAVCEKLELVVEEARKASELVRQIQDFSRRTGGEKEITDLSLFVGQSEMFLRRTIPENVKMEVEIKCNDCHVMADFGALQQMLVTVALNAKDSMANGGLFRIRLRKLILSSNDAAPVAGMTEGSWAVLEFTDTGAPPPSQILPKIFDSFFGEKDSGRGRGLAFAQVFGIVRQHDGFMQLGSEEPLGMVLRVFLPIVELKDKLLDNMKNEQQMVRGDGELILLVDDEVSVLKSTKAALDLLGYRIITASDGVEALRIFKERRGEFALVVSDVVMPDMGGFELLESIHEEDPSMKVLLVSGYSARVSKDGLDDKIAGWLEKPWTLPELASTVRKCLE